MAGLMADGMVDPTAIDWVLTTVDRLENVSDIPMA